MLLAAVVGFEQLRLKVVERELALHDAVQDQLGGAVEQHQREPQVWLVLVAGEPQRLLDVDDEPLQPLHRARMPRAEPVAPPGLS